MKNIVLIITDTFRYDNLGNRAKRPVRTPELDRFIAERATEVQRFYMGSFPTIPHRTDLTRGVLGWPHYGWQSLNLSGPNHAPSILNEAGYNSQLICDCPHLFNSGFQFDFNAAFQHRGQESDVPLLHLNDPVTRVLPLEKTRTDMSWKGGTLADVHRWVNRYYTGEADTFCAKTSATSVRWLEENNEAGPFFVWVDFFDPHEPWDPPEYLVRRYDPDYVGTPMIHPNYGRSSDYTPEELHNLWAHYAAESELVDRTIGRILQKIDDLQLWDDTIVLVTADHGTSLGEHARTAKSNLSENDDRFWPIYPEISHVPFLIAGGDIPRGASLDLIAQPIDILPTLLELAGVDATPPVPFQGKSFAKPLLNGAGDHRTCAVAGQYADAGQGVQKSTAMPFLITERWGYAPLGERGGPELFDLTKDPLAESDIIAEHADVVPGLHQLFVEHLREHGASDAFVELWRNKQNKEGTMLVAAKLGKGQAGLIEKPDPTAQDDFVVVKIHVAPACTEYKSLPSEGRTESLGHEAAGEVVEVAQPGKVKVGDRVVVMPQYPCGTCYLCLSGEYIHCRNSVDMSERFGPDAATATYAQCCIKQDWLLIPIPDGMSYEHASMACCGLGPTFNAMKLMSVEAFDTVLVSGLGPVGLGGVINARYRGARVIGVDTHPYRAKLAKQLGAEAVVNPTDANALEQIRDLTGGLGVHKAVETSGVGASKTLLLDAVRRKGQAAFVGWNGQADVDTIISKGLSVHGAWHYNLADAPRMMQMIAETGGQLDKLITHVFPMKDVQKAWELQATGECGKVLLKPWEE